MCLELAFIPSPSKLGWTAGIALMSAYIAEIVTETIFK
jgi:hypothetical protein